MEELVSVIIPVYNAEKYITNCVKAVQNQIYGNLEIILVNDGSTDRSGTICDNLSKTDSRIQVLHKANGGVSTARNEGIKIAKGKYLMFADSDDIPENCWVSRMVELSYEWNADFVICAYRTVSCFNEAMQPICHDKLFEPAYAMTDVEYYETLGYVMTYRGTIFAPWNKLYIAEIIKKNNVMFPEDVWYGEDFLFILQYLKYCNRIIETRERLYNYIMQNPDSLEKKYKPDLFENQTLLFRAAKSFMIEQNVYEGHNVYNLASYYTYAVIRSVKNQFNKENKKTEIQTRKYIETFFQNDDVAESSVLAHLYEIDEQIIYTDLVTEKQYDKIYDAFKNICEGTRPERAGSIRYKILPEQVRGWKWLPYTIKSVKKYGCVITFKRVLGKIGRMFRRK